jgi:hypothetical protein
MALSATSSVGRLVELRLVGDATLDEAIQFERDTQQCILACARRSGRPVVICTDIRASQLLRPEVSERLVGLMRGSNSRSVERNGVLGSGSALSALQGVRILKKADSEARRRMFKEPEPLLAWLDEALDAPERARLRAFLAEHMASDLGPAAFGGAALVRPSRHWRVRRPGKSGPGKG